VAATRRAHWLIDRPGRREAAWLWHWQTKQHRPGRSALARRCCATNETISPILHKCVPGPQEGGRGIDSINAFDEPVNGAFEHLERFVPLALRHVGEFCEERLQLLVNMM